MIFVAALDCYDMVCFEDNNANRMTESLELFARISNNEWFVDVYLKAKTIGITALNSFICRLENSSIILFLNKVDLFAEKIKRHPIKSYFEDYTGEVSIN